MGHPETLLPPPPPFPAIACLQLSRYDAFRLIGFPAEIIPLVRQAAIACWPKGIQREGDVEGCCWEFKFRGNPWLGQGDDAIPSRRLMTAVIHALDTVGWTIYMSCDLSKQEADKDAIFFRHTGIARRRSYCSISFNKTDRVRLIDSPSGIVTKSFGEAVQTWFRGAEVPSKHRFSISTSIDDPGCLEYKLGGNPWVSPVAIEVIQARMLCCRLLEAMSRAGYELAASVDMSVGGGGMDMSTWFFASATDTGMSYAPAPSNIGSLGYPKN